MLFKMAGFHLESQVELQQGFCCNLLLKIWVMFSTLVQHYKEACGMLMSAGPKTHEKQDLNSNLAPHGQSNLLHCFDAKSVNYLAK